MKVTWIFALLLAISACTHKEQDHAAPNATREKAEIGRMLDQWHRDAAKADTNYFRSLAAQAVYIGTDKTEHWSKKEFIKFATPYFEKGQAWNFKPLERNLFIAESGQLAWFDELLATWMGTCRASGVLVRESGTWKISHYHLSLAVPNEKMREVIQIIDEKPLEAEQ
mgnify:CR=1 FL=1